MRGKMISQRSHHEDQINLRSLKCFVEIRSAAFFIYIVFYLLQCSQICADYLSFLTKIYFGTLKDLYIHEKQTAKLRNNPIL